MIDVNELQFIEDSDTQLLNNDPLEVFLFALEISMDTKLEQLLNIEGPTIVDNFGISMLVKFVQLLNAYSLIHVVFGKSIDDNDEQSSKACFPTDSTFGQYTDTKLEHCPNTPLVYL